MSNFGAFFIFCRRRSRSWSVRRYIDRKALRLACISLNFRFSRSSTVEQVSKSEWERWENRIWELQKFRESIRLRLGSVACVCIHEVQLGSIAIKKFRGKPAVSKLQNLLATIVMQLPWLLLCLCFRLHSLHNFPCISCIRDMRTATPPPPHCLPLKVRRK